MTSLANLRVRFRAEVGSVTVFVVILAPALVMMAGLAFDGGRILSARRQAFDVAQNAAIAGTQAIDVTGVHGGESRLDPGLVAVAVNSYLAEAGATGTHTMTDETVTVTVTQTVDMELLDAVGVGPKTVTGTATARIVRGVEGPDT